MTQFPVVLFDGDRADRIHGTAEQWAAFSPYVFNHCYHDRFIREDVRLACVNAKTMGGFWIPAHPELVRLLAIIEEPTAEQLEGQIIPLVSFYP